MKSTRDRGRTGEDIALKYLTSQGHSLVKRNHFSRRGEIDLITLKGHTLHFVEVKRWKIPAANLEYSINRLKQRRIVHTATDFLARNTAYEECEKQFDLLYVEAANNAVHYMEQAFDGGER